MFFAACLFGLLTLPGVHADGWDDFSNNLATDLAPFLSLFGEQITKQYLSESIAMIDYFIFAMAPMGILTAIVSAIRVCGSPSLRAFIGRAQEGGGVAEAELCSSTSRDVCELYNNGGIARVFGRPKILEGFIKKNPEKWTRIQPPESPGSPDNSEDMSNGFAPNLSLNVGIKRKPPVIFWTVAMIGMVLQAGVLVFAVLVTYYFRWEKDGIRLESYACPLTITGTLLLSGGIFLCAFLVGESTKEQVFRRNLGSGDKKAARETLYWVQPGGQVLGDQIFDAFCCSDRGEPLKEYITSWKNQSKIPQIVVWVAVGISVIGFVMQFVGLRAIHSAVSVAQLGAIMLMSAARAALRMQRLKPEDNFLAQCPDEVVGHELDWLALRIGWQDIRRRSYSSSPAQSLDSPRLLWRFCGTLGITTENVDPPSPNASEKLNDAAKLLAYRTRLAQLTQSHNTQNKGTNSAECFDVGMVEVREYSRRLTFAIEAAANTIFPKSPNWRDTPSMFWNFACDVAFVEPYVASEDRPIQHIIYIRLTRKEPTTPWKLQNQLELEGLLGLWVWSLKSDPAVETSDSKSHFTISRAIEIPRERIVSINENIETDLKLWLGDKIPIITEHELDPTYVKRGNQSITRWKPGDAQGKEIRFFGWHATETSQIPDPTPLTIMSAQTDSSLLSLCAQEVFGSFIASILKITDDIGDINIQETPHLRLESSLVTEMIKLFAEAQLGSNEDALLCILPTMIPRLRLSYMENAVVAAKRMANQHRRAGEWMQAETVLRWAWEVCNKSQPHASKDGCQNDQPIHADADEPIQQAAIALGELYRWAMRDNETKEFGLRGIEWLSCQVPSRQGPSPSVHDAIIARYNDIAKRVVQQENNAGGIRLHILSKIRGYSTGPSEVKDPLSEITEIRDDLTESSRFGDDSSEISEISEDLSETSKIHDNSKRVSSFRDCSRESSENTDDLRTISEIEDGLSEILLYITLPIPITNEDKGKILGLTAKHGWTEVVLALLELGAEPDFKDPNQNSRTALSQAAENGSINAMKELIDWGAFPNSTDATYRTPLSYASEMGHGSAVQILLGDQRVDPNAKDMRDLTPLLWAALKGHGAVVKLLVESGKVDLDANDHDEHTPLALAAIHGSEAIAKLLVQNGAELDAVDRHGYTALTHAAKNGHEAVVLLLAEEGADINVKTDIADTPLMLAAVGRHRAIVELLAQKGADLEAKDDNIWTALMHSTLKGPDTAAKLLIQSDTDLNAKDNDGRTALTYAVTRSDKEIMELLVQSDADLNGKDGNAGAILTYATECLHKAIVKQMIQSGADVNAKDNGGRAVLIYALAVGDNEFVKLLVQSGADTNTKDNEGLTVLNFAAWTGNKESVELLIQSGADVNAKDDKGRTAIAYATLIGSEEIVGLLVQSGADVNAKDDEGLTAIAYATLRWNKEIVELLVQNGADVNAKDNKGQTALANAARRGHKDIVGLLVQSGADVNAKDDEGQTAIAYATLRGHNGIVELLDRPS